MAVPRAILDGVKLPSSPSIQAINVDEARRQRPRSQSWSTAEAILGSKCCTAVGLLLLALTILAAWKSIDVGRDFFSPHHKMYHNALIEELSPSQRASVVQPLLAPSQELDIAVTVWLRTRGMHCDDRTRHPRSSYGWGPRGDTAVFRHRVPKNASDGQECLYQRELHTPDCVIVSIPAIQASSLTSKPFQPPSQSHE